MTKGAGKEQAAGKSKKPPAFVILRL